MTYLVILETRDGLSLFPFQKRDDALAFFDAHSGQTGERVFMHYLAGDSAGPVNITAMRHNAIVQRAMVEEITHG